MPVSKIHRRLGVFCKFPVLVIHTPKKIPSVDIDWVPGNRALLAAVESVNRRHILRAQFEVVHRCVADHTSGVRGLRQGRESKNKIATLMKFS